MHVAIEHLQLIADERERDFVLLARLRGDTRWKPLELHTGRATDASSRERRAARLRRPRACRCSSPCIAPSPCRSARSSAGSIASVGILERRVAQPKAERKERLAGEIEVVVAAAGRLVIVDERQLALGHRERDRQPARGIVVAEQHVGDRVAALLARIPASITAPTRSSQRDIVIALPPTSTTTSACRSPRRARSALPDGPAGRATRDRETRLPRCPATTIATSLCRAAVDGAVDLRAPVVGDAGVPDELHARVAGALEVLEANVVRRFPARSAHVGEARAVRLLLPVVDDELVVEIEPIAVVAFDADAPHAASAAR